MEWDIKTVAVDYWYEDRNAQVGEAAGLVLGP